jgi:homoserine kinase
VTAGLRAVPRHEGPRVSVAQARARIGGCEIAVPASAANLGPGFDAIAVALQMYLRIRVCEVFDGSLNGLTFDLCGTPLTGENYIERAFRAMAAAERLEFPSLSIEVRTEIPMKGGLGSSAAATVAGLRLFERLAGPRDGRDLLRAATELDVHADNVAAALLGGLAISCVAEDGAVFARAIPWPSHIGFIVASPEVHLATPDARRVLPEVYSREDAVYNLQRALLLVHAIEHDEVSLVREAIRDRWHQPYRATLVPGLAEALALQHPSLVGVCLSGSGPSVLALATGDFEEIAGLFRGVYSRLQVPCDVRAVAAHQPGAVS